MSKDAKEKKRLQVIFSDETWSMITALTNEVNRDFNVGTITYSDVVNEMILSSKVDLKTLQAKHTDIKRSLRHIASQGDVDLDGAIKALMDLKAKLNKRVIRHNSQADEASNV